MARQKSENTTIKTKTRMKKPKKEPTPPWNPRPKSSPNKESTRKPKYGMLSCLAYMYRLLWTHERSLVFTAALNVPLLLASSALALYTPVILLEYLEKSDHFSTIALVIFGLVLADMIKSLVRAVLDAKSSMSEYYIMCRLARMLECRKLDRDFFLDYDT